MRGNVSRCSVTVTWFAGSGISCVMPDYRNLRVFDAANALNTKVHTLAPHIQVWRAPGLRAQLCRAVSSVPANIAEGAMQGSAKQYLRYLRIASGSAQEAIIHLRLAASLGMRTANAFHECECAMQIVAAMLVRLIARIEEDEARKHHRERGREMG